MICKIPHMRFFLLIVSLIFSPVIWAQRFNGKIFEAVNSAFDEQNPVLSPDGNTLYFTIGNHPANAGGKRDPGDIWISRMEGSQWSIPVNGGPLLNDKAYNAVAGLSADGDQLFLHGHYDPSGNIAKTQGISVSRNKGAGWTRPENIIIPYFLNKSGTLCGTVSTDNSVFIYSAESYGTFGVEDIYVSIRQQGKWGESKNLGKIINTQFQELSPSLSNDMKTLYFSSNGRMGKGSFDVYSSTRLDDTWVNWSPPVNMGSPVNSEGRELYFRAYTDQGFALYTTTQSSDGYGDLKIHFAGEPLPVNDTVIYASLKRDETLVKESSIRIETLAGKESIEKEEPEKKESVKVYGKIINAKTGEAIAANISFESPGLSEQSVSADNTGYSLLLAASTYLIRIEANGYISAIEKLDSKPFEMGDLEMNFRLQPLEVGTTVNLKNVLFVQTKTDILPESFPELNLVVSFLKENPTVKIQLMGHTDSRGVHADNVMLSQQRVNKVKQYLVSKGIESKRISGKGLGGSKPIASNDTEESRRMNRRVEFVIKKF